MKKFLFLVVPIFTCTHIAYSSEKRHREEGTGLQLAPISRPPLQPKDVGVKTPVASPVAPESIERSPIASSVASPTLPKAPELRMVVVQKFFPTFPGVPGCLYMERDFVRIPAEKALGMPLVGSTDVKHEIAVLSEFVFPNRTSMAVVQGMVREDRVLGGYFSINTCSSGTRQILTRFPKDFSDRADLFELKK